MLEEEYDLAKREEGNLGIKKTFVRYNLLDEKDKEIYQKSKSVENQVKLPSNKKIKDNNHSYKYGNPPKFEKKAILKQK